MIDFEISQTAVHVATERVNEDNRRKTQLQACINGGVCPICAKDLEKVIDDNKNISYKCTSDTCDFIWHQPTKKLRTYINGGFYTTKIKSLGILHEPNKRVISLPFLLTLTIIFFLLISLFIYCSCYASSISINKDTQVLIRLSSESKYSMITAKSGYHVELFAKDLGISPIIKDKVYSCYRVAFLHSKLLEQAASCLDVDDNYIIDLWEMFKFY